MYEVRLEILGLFPMQRHRLRGNLRSFEGMRTVRLIRAFRLTNALDAELKTVRKKEPKEGFNFFSTVELR